MKAVITTVGKDKVGILALIANTCAEHQINILDVSQTIVEDIFTMTMIVDTERLDLPLDEFARKIREIGEENGLVIRLMSKDIFDSMHRV